MKKQLTLTIVYKDKKVLLGLKKRGFGVGRWNGFGGKIEDGETITEAAARELQEESGIVAHKLEKMGILDFEFENDPKILQVHIFCVTEFEQEPVETEEMKPQWFDTDKIPFDAMWSDDIHWMPYLLDGKKFEGKFLFDRPSDADYQSKILSMDLIEI
jgi:8-oxo-dGTP diphosphatase/2-hydroxy-dATP diphosphatase